MTHTSGTGLEELYEIGHSIIYDCPLIKMPQTRFEKLGMMHRVIVLKGATDDDAALIAKALAALVQPVAWRCFHCGEVFTTRESAQEHFGRSEYQTPGCQIDIAEYRRMEEVNRRHCDADTDLHREIHAEQSKGQQNAIRAEEAGYAKGLADARKHPHG